MFVWRSEKDTSRNCKSGIHTPLVCSVAGVVKRSLHTRVFSCPIKPSSKLHRHVRLTGEGRRGRGGTREEMRGEEVVLAVIRRHLAVTALVSLDS